MTEEFGGYHDPGSLPQRDGVPVKPGDEERICDTCYFCKVPHRRLVCTVEPPGPYHFNSNYPVEPYHYCERWLPSGLTRASLRLRIKRREAEIERREAERQLRLEANRKRNRVPAWAQKEAEYEVGLTNAQFRADVEAGRKEDARIGTKERHERGVD